MPEDALQSLTTTSRTSTTRVPIAPGTTQNDNQNHKRSTRPQIALPSFSVDYDRSPLKHARDAVRRANARLSPSPSLVESDSYKDENGSGSGKSGADTKMADILARVGTRNALFARAERGDDLLRQESKEEVVMDDAEKIDQPIEDTESTVDFNNDHPKLPKRARSASFDDVSPPLLSKKNSRTEVDALQTSSKPPPAEADTIVQLRMQSSASTPDTNPPANSASNSKRAKVSKQNTLHAFFARPSIPPSLSSSAAQKPSIPSSTTPRRIFNEASTSTPPQPPQSSRPKFGEIPATPTIQQLRAIPTLDLRTLTPSPRKRPFGLGHGGNNEGRSPMKGRAVSSGAALSLERPEGDGEAGNGQSSHVEKSDEKRATSEPLEETESSLQGTHNTPPKSSSPPSPPSPALGAEQEQVKGAPRMDIDTVNKEHATTPAAPQHLPSIAISTSTPTSAISTSEHTALPEKALIPEPVPSALAPSTPIHKILPSRPIPSNQLPSLFSMSPLTPLPGAHPQAQISDGYDYEEEERATKEESRRMEAKETAKVAMQEETEVGELPVASTSCVPPSDSNQAEPIEAPATESKPGKPDSKGKGKGKTVSSASRLMASPAGIKKRKSLVPTSMGTPRMRLTRAAVLRQKAVQAQLRSPTKGKTLTARPSLFGAKGAKLSVDDKEGSEKKRSEGPFAQPQRSPRKTFVLTVPSSLSPSKANSAASSANSSMTLKSAPADAGPPKPFSFSLYPPSMKDAAATARAQRVLSNLSSALDKLAMPPPSILSSSAGRTAPASEQKERVRPASSLGFSREMSLPVSSSGGFGSKPKPTSRAGSVDLGQGKKSVFPPPPPTAFGSSLTKDKRKSKAFASASRTLPLASKSIAGGSNQPRPPTFNFGNGAGANGGMAGVFGRPIPRIRASQKTSLETVEGSPVKGAAPPRMFAEDEEDDIVAADTNGQEAINVDGNVSVTSLHSQGHQSTSSNSAGDMSISSAEGNDSITATGDTNVAMTESGKELKRISKLNASRRASMAFSALSQSLATPSDPATLSSSKDSNISAEASAEQTPESSSAGKGRSERVSLTLSTSSRPTRAAAPRSFTFGAPGLVRSQSEITASNNLRGSSATPVGVSESDGEGSGKSSKKSGGGSMGRTKMPGSLDVLDQCTIFVDVRTEEGEDAGALFVDMLRGLGAKVLTRVGQTCTHIVYKNGLASTLTRYRLLDEPRPSVVGIGWVVECVEKRNRVDETRFQVNLEGVNVAGTLKRRKSFLPKQLPSVIPAPSGPMDAFLSGTGPSAQTTSKASADLDSAIDDADAGHDDAVKDGTNQSSNFHPLERARRRSIMIPR